MLQSSAALGDGALRRMAWESLRVGQEQCVLVKRPPERDDMPDAISNGQSGTVMIQLRGDVRENHLLAALPTEEWQKFDNQLEIFRLQRVQVLSDHVEKINHLYFPTTAIVSLMYTMENGGSVEIAAVGNEGVVGGTVLTGGETMTSRAQDHSAGFGYRISATAFKQHFQQSPFMHRLMLLYMQALMTQIAQTAA